MSMSMSMIALWLIIVTCTHSETCSLTSGTYTVHWYIHDPGREFYDLKDCRDYAQRKFKGVMTKCQWEELPA